MEREIVRRRSVEFHGISAGKLRRYFSVRNVVDLFLVAGGILGSIRLILKLRPAVLFSKGGFVSVPPVIAAGLLGVPVVSHESDADPGLATRINARFSRRICVAYESTREYFRPEIRERVVVTGNPVRPEIFAGTRDAGLSILGFDPADERPVVTFLGGSLGARQVNALVAGLRDLIRTRWRIVHQSGENSIAPVRSSDYVTRPFFSDELPDILAASDLLVCRAGASTIWEGAALGRPMLLVPLVEGSRGDQVRNAAIFERAGGARVFLQPETLVRDVAAALDYFRSTPAARHEMGEKARATVRLDATEKLVDLLTTYMEE